MRLARDAASGGFGDVPSDVEKFSAPEGRKSRPLRGRAIVLEGLNLDVARGDVVTLVGQSGVAR